MKHRTRILPKTSSQNCDFLSLYNSLRIVVQRRATDLTLRRNEPFITRHPSCVFTVLTALLPKIFGQTDKDAFELILACHPNSKVDRAIPSLYCRSIKVSVGLKHRQTIHGCYFLGQLPQTHMIHRFTEEKSSAIRSRNFELDGRAGRVHGDSLPTNMPVRFQCLPSEIRVMILEHCLRFEGVINPFPKIYGCHEAEDPVWIAHDKQRTKEWASTDRPSLALLRVSSQIHREAVVVFFG